MSPDDFLALVAGEIFGRTIHGRVPPIKIVDIDRVAGIFEQLTVAFFALAQSFFSEPLIGDVARHSPHDGSVNPFGA